jgi:hypothetical protein
MKSNSNRPSSYNKLTYIQKAARINKKLRTGDISRIAEATGFSASYTSEVISGKYFNDSLLNKAYDMTRGRIATAQRLASVQG